MSNKKFCSESFFFLNNDLSSLSDFVHLYNIAQYHRPIHSRDLPLPCKVVHRGFFSVTTLCKNKTKKPFLSPGASRTSDANRALPTASRKFADPVATARWRCHRLAPRAKRTQTRRVTAGPESFDNALLIFYHTVLELAAGPLRFTRAQCPRRRRTIE